MCPCYRDLIRSLDVGNTDSQIAIFVFWKSFFSPQSQKKLWKLCTLKSLAAEHFAYFIDPVPQFLLLISRFQLLTTFVIILYYYGKSCTKKLVFSNGNAWHVVQQWGLVLGYPWEVPQRLKLVGLFYTLNVPLKLKIKNTWLIFLLNFILSHFAQMHPPLLVTIG